MAAFQSLLFLGMGCFLLGLDWIGFRRGWLPFGSKAFLVTLKYYRNESPAGFWFAFATYLCAGTAMIVYAIMLAAELPPQCR